jgi:hypothetical protein
LQDIFKSFHPPFSTFFKKVEPKQTLKKVKPKIKSGCFAQLFLKVAFLKVA